ncbi:MAG: hypothetical protein SFV23_19475, partial [Planctomycetaceae bacterium]|nr:hypothetical protein [Planctomycetaceae bacterium]
MNRPSVAPESSSTVLVSRTSYNARGEVFETTDPAGLVTHTDFDDAGRQIRTIQNYQGEPASCGEDGCCCDSICGNKECACPIALGDDVNLTVETSYTADGQVATLTAKNPATGDQVTRYEYGTTREDSGI